MAYLGKTFTLSAQDKFDEFLSSLGVPQDKLSKILSEKPSETLTKDGDAYTLKIRIPSDERTLVFKSGVEVDDLIAGQPVKATFVVNGDTIVETQKFGERILTFKKAYSADKLVVTATNNKWDGVATRTYS